MLIDETRLIRDPAALQALYGPANPVSLTKEVDYLHPHYQAFVRAAPFAVLATVSPEGVDASPRGETPGFVEIEDDRTLLLPDRRGNNRADSLLNILADPRVALLFLIPGVNETLRVNGRAVLSVDPALLQRFAMDGKPARSVLILRVETVYFQCARALLRSELWNPERHLPRSALPSTGTMVADFTREAVVAAEYDRDLDQRQRASLW
jgi:PPOX class probable FMN-dependent enzyme